MIRETESATNVDFAPEHSPQMMHLLPLLIMHCWHTIAMPPFENVGLSHVFVTKFSFFVISTSAVARYACPSLTAYFQPPGTDMVKVQVGTTPAKALPTPSLPSAVLRSVGYSMS